MRLDLAHARTSKKHKNAFTLAEVVMAIAIVAMVFGGMIVAYIQATKRAQWSGYSLAAQGLAIQQLEQARSASWDPCIPRNEITNLNLISMNLSNGGSMYTMTGYSWTNLDLPTSGNNYVPATNYVTVRLLYNNNSSTPPVQFQMIRVDTVWAFTWGSSSRFFTNSVCTYAAPDNRDVSTLFY
jgi:prepilin-type N-terminal cleavage/methylation domain-containing protein